LEQLDDLSAGLLNQSVQLVSLAPGLGEDRVGTVSGAVRGFRRRYLLVMFLLRMGLGEDLVLEFTPGLPQFVEKLISQLSHPRAARSGML
jgi:hypothetical protein